MTKDSTLVPENFEYDPFKGYFRGEDDRATVRVRVGVNRQPDLHRINFGRVLSTWLRAEAQVKGGATPSIAERTLNARAGCEEITNAAHELAQLAMQSQVMRKSTHDRVA